MINLRSGLHRSLLGYYFANPEAEHYLRELSRLLSHDVANLSRELNRLTRNGIFIASLRGRQKFFRLNRAHPLFRKFHDLVLEMIDLEKEEKHRIRIRRR
jgi:predicted transcriptional regulator